MTVETLRHEVEQALQQLAWDLWAQLGVSGVTPARRAERAADPEALVLFTLEVGRTEPRLFDEVLDWLALNEPLVSAQRLRNLCTTDADRMLVDATLAWVMTVRRPRSATRPGSEGSGTAELEPLFPWLSTAVTEQRDPVFAAHGLDRPPITRSGKSRPPRLQDPIAFALRLRRLLGVGARAEVVRTLLTIRAPWLSGRVITASAGFAQRNVREALSQLNEAGVVDVIDVAGDRHFSVRFGQWAALLGMGSAADLPFHYDWIPAYRALTRILRWVQQPELADLSPYLRASQARSLVEAIEADLRYLGITMSPNASREADFWEEFVQLIRLVIRSARE